MNTPLSSLDMLHTTDTHGPGTWVSWNENISHNYKILHVIKNEDQLAHIVHNADHVRMFGHRYSSADICAGSPTLLDMTCYDQILHVDESRREITAQSGITLATFLERIEHHGWELPCLPDINAVTLGGALATGTHGTGREGHILAHYMTRCRVVLASGEVVEVDEDHAWMPALRVSLGVLGVLSEVTLRCAPQRTLHIKEGPMRDEEWLSRLDELHAAHPFLRILWLPHTDHGYVITGDEVSPDAHIEAREGPSWLTYRRRASKLLYQYAYMFPRITSVANNLLFLAFFTARKSHKGTLYGATVTKKRSSTMQLGEWTIARSRFDALFAELKAELNDPGNQAYAHVPMDIRFLAREEHWLSYAYGEDCVTVGCVCRDSPHADRYAAFEMMERVFLKHGGRPHWAKTFEATHEQLREVYPRWDAFVALREELDPSGKFLNARLQALLGVTGER